ncbi:unnamed protein product [Linum trigynum]|uniref:Protein FAR1-RELATED SEQUENCE n=1 Tax=Linum trigynum TaxID=586398 RepID=A0AAV2E8D5_9ROSI
MAGEENHATARQDSHCEDMDDFTVKREEYDDQDDTDIPIEEVNVNGDDDDADHNVSNEENPLTGDDEENENLASLTDDQVIGRKFNNIEEAYAFYNKYARAWGFLVGREKKYKTKEGQIT